MNNYSNAVNESAIISTPSSAVGSTYDADDICASLLNRFEILKPIEASESARYYLAREPGREAIVIIKTLGPGAAQDPRQVELFHLETQAAARLLHENLVRVYEHQSFGGIHLCVIEHKPNVETLRQLLQRKGQLDYRQAISIASQVAAALDYAHKVGVLHLNLEPDKILIGPDDKVFVTGFGLEAESDLAWAHKLRSLSCTAQYISPEQIIGDNLDHRTDLYALGLLLYEMLADRVPFDSENPDHIKQKRLRQTPWPLDSLCPGVPQPLSQVVTDLIRIQPGERVQDAAELQSLLERLSELDLESLVEDDPSLALPVNCDNIFNDPLFSEGLSVNEASPTDDLNVLDELNVFIELDVFDDLIMPEQRPFGLQSDAPVYSDVAQADLPSDDSPGVAENLEATLYDEPAEREASADVIYDQVLSEPEPVQPLPPFVERSIFRPRLLLLIALIAAVAGFITFAYTGKLRYVFNRTGVASSVSPDTNQAPEGVEAKEETLATESKEALDPANNPELEVSRELSVIEEKDESAHKKSRSSFRASAKERAEDVKPSSAVLMVPLSNDESAIKQTVTPDDKAGNAKAAAPDKAGGKKTNSVMRIVLEKTPPARTTLAGPPQNRKAATVP